MNFLKLIRLRQENNLLQVSRYLRHFGIKYTTSNIKKLLIDHTEYPSLLSLIDTFQVYGIESRAIRKGNYAYSDFETPFICAIQKDDWAQSSFTIVTSCDASNITYLDPLTERLKECSMMEFEKIDKEVILLLDATKKKDELGYQRNMKSERADRVLSQVPLYAFLIFIILALGIQLTSLPTGFWISPVFLVTSAIGLCITLLLMWHDVDAHNPFIKEICGGRNKSKLNCNAVLSSNSAKLIGISWSVWGFSYFASFCITQIVFPNQIGYLVIWSLLSIAAVFYLPYSLFYQVIVIKQWCPLCLGVLSIVLTNSLLSAIFLYQQSASLSVSLQPVLNVSFLSVVLLLAAYHAIPLLKKAQESRDYKLRFEKLRFNPDVFRSLLKKNSEVSHSPEGLGIVIGNLSAKNEIIKVCNPYCGPCSRAHPELEYIIRNNPDVRLRMIFTATGDQNDIKTLPVAHFLSIQQKYGEETVKKALDDWHLAEDKDYEVFAKKYPMNGELKEQQEKMHAMTEWCNVMKIRATPTIFINNCELPDLYNITELKNFF